MGRGLEVADVRDPAHPRIVVTGLPIGSPYFDLALRVQRLFALHGDDFQWGEFSIFDVSIPEGTHRIWGPWLTGYSRGTIGGDWYYQLFFEGPLGVLRVYDISSGAFVDRGEAVRLDADAQRVSAFGDRAYVSTTVDVRVFDVRGDGVPEATGSIPIAGKLNPTASTGSVLYVVARDERLLHTVDVRRPAAPALLGSMELSGYAGDIAISQGLALAVSDALHIVDATDPATPTEIGSLGFDSLPRRVVVERGLAIVATDDSILIIDLSSCLPCLPDIDRDGALDLFDFLEFQRLFSAGDVRADFDGDGALTVFDFLAFQNAFQAGC
ncbi:MAG: GC-type dockerin domain-anchored protein [Phycisphaerales bacterium]